MASEPQPFGSSTSHSTHTYAYKPNNFDKMASNSTYSIAKLFLADPIFSNFPITLSSYILDNACGTGVVTSAIKSKYPFARILGTDLAPGMIEAYESKAASRRWENTETKLLDSRDLKGLQNGLFSHVIMNFGFMPDKGGPEQVVKEIWRVLGNGGLAIVTTWADRGRGNAIEATALRIRPNEKHFASDVPAEMAHGWWLMKQLEDAGFGYQVIVKSVEGYMEAETLEQLVDNLLVAKEYIYKGYRVEEQSKLPGILAEEMRKLDTFDERKDSVRNKMVAWVGIAWK